MRDRIEKRFNENKRTVVVFKTGLKEELENIFLKFGLFDDLHDSFPFIKDRIVGKAVCREDDTFDAEIGYKIAVAKFKKNYKEEVIKSIDKLISDEYKYIDKLKALKDKFKIKDENEIISKY